MKKKIILFLIISVFLIVSVFIYLCFYFGIIPSKKYSDSDFKIDKYISRYDMDDDGVDDQTDILENAKKYIATKPIYKSKYYAGGYSDDEYGVCTDVVANALLDSGYDLRELVNADILKNRDDYDIDKVDKNIDFRRVRNLLIYFKNNAISLTTDIYKIDEWHGGDIVIFPNHIAIVSDSRNRKGIPYVIHLSPRQIRYEENILERRKVIGHYRIS